MLHHTRGIALHTTKFSETSIIARVYTERFGLQAYLLKGVRSPRAKIKPALFLPMTLLDLTVYHKEKSTLHSIREASNNFPYYSTGSDIRKSAVLLYINELIWKSVREEEPNQGLFDFIYENCRLFDGLNENVHLFPLWFTVHLTRFLGFAPSVEKSKGLNVFNMKEGTFHDSTPAQDPYIDGDECRLLKIILESGIHHPSSIIHHPITNIDYPTSSIIRNNLLEKMLLYYQIHLPGFHGIRSHIVLHEVLS
jgi:DNA repair protein RecO (recombination protein O)